MVPIRILLANHHPIIRSSLRLLLERQPEFQVVAEAANGREAVVLADYKRPEIVLLEVELPHLNGIAAAKEISSKDVLSRLIFVTEQTDEVYAFEAFKAGARGYVAGDAAPTDLTRAIHVVANGGRFLSPAISLHVLERHGLPAYERQMCSLLAAGYNEHEIAASLNTDAVSTKAGCISIDNILQRDGSPEFIANIVRLNREVVRAGLTRG